MKHKESSPQAQQLNSEEQIESEINSWFDQTTWDEAEREISPDEVLGKEEEENLSFGDRMAYKSYLSTKCQHRESRAKLGVWKTFMKRWAKAHGMITLDLTHWCWACWGKKTTAELDVTRAVLGAALALSGRHFWGTDDCMGWLGETGKLVTENYGNWAVIYYGTGGNCLLGNCDCGSGGTRGLLTEQCGSAPGLSEVLVNDWKLGQTEYTRKLGTGILLEWGCTGVGDCWGGTGLRLTQTAMLLITSATVEDGVTGCSGQLLQLGGGRRRINIQLEASNWELVGVTGVEDGREAWGGWGLLTSHTGDCGEMYGTGMRLEVDWEQGENWKVHWNQALKRNGKPELVEMMAVKLSGCPETGQEQLVGVGWDDWGADWGEDCCSLGREN
ncbi:hypothetical protein Tco_0610697 [Tanacetum coccineum]